jgi:sugar fermentation stimulation protein A
VRIPGPLLHARFVARPNRFLTVVELNGQEIEAHLPDPGRLKELLLPGAPVWVRPATGRLRKTRYTLVLVRAPCGELVSVVTTLANALVAEALNGKRIAELADWEIVAREWTWRRNRFDFLLGTAQGARLLVEVKSVTLVQGGRALFPDAVTARGARHVRELTAVTGEGLQAALFFVVQRRDASSVSAARHIDPEFADALACAQESGVELLGYRSEVSVGETRLAEAVPVVLDRACL